MLHLRATVPVTLALMLLNTLDDAAATGLSPINAANNDKPNIVFLLTDDQDVMLGGLDPQTKLHNLLTTQGMTFTNAFVHTPICCPSRSSYMSGRYIHNGGAKNNSVSGNCNGEVWQNGPEKRTFAVHGKSAGYVTSYAGKYLNQYALPGSPNCHGPGQPGCGTVPPGWDQWLGLVGNSKYYNYNVSRNGQIEHHGSEYATDYFPDLVANFTIDFILQSAKNHPGQPILTVTAWPSPHGPRIAAPQYKDRFAGRQAPRTPNWNASDEYQSTKHWLVRHQDIITESNAQGIDNDFQERWDTLLSVDDHVERIVQALDQTNRLDNTYIFYMSDHGFQLGQQRLLGDKRHLYENDIRIPFIVRGPGVPKNATDDSIVLNIDVAPTFTDIMTGSVPDDMDGTSFKDLLSGKKSSQWREDFLIDYHGEGGPCNLYQCPPPASNFHEIDGKNNTYTCVRTLQQKGENTIYCQFVDSENFVEYYDINKDPWQLHNGAKSLPSEKEQQLKAKLAKLKACSGKDCRSL